MSSLFPNGAKLAVSTTRSAAAAITALSNAAPPSATTAVAPATGTYAIVTSNWPQLNGEAVRATNVDATHFTLDGLNTSDVVRYPAGEGIGSFQTVGGFVSLTQVRDMSFSGGDQNYFTYQYLEDEGGRQRQKPTFKSPLTIKITLDYDPALPWFDAMVDIDRLREAVVVRETLSNGDVLLFVGEVSFNKVPTQTANENMTVTATVSLQADPIRYNAAP